jgi:hypothetical protein
MISYIQDIAVENLLSELNEKLIEQNDEKRYNNLFLGDLSHALFYAYYGLLFNDEQSLDRSIHIISEHMSIAEKLGMNFKLGYGVTGLGWMIQFLTNSGLLDKESEKDLEQLDTLVQKSLKFDEEDKNYDLFTGSIGKGLYFLERNNSFSEKALEEIVDQLKRHAVREENGITWLDHYTSANDITKRDAVPYYNFGLAHGIPSVIRFLTLCFHQNINKADCRQLINESCKWLLYQYDANEATGYPSVKYTGKVKYPYLSSLSWSYGGASVAFAMQDAYEITGDMQFKNHRDLLIDKIVSISAAYQQKTYDANLEKAINSFNYNSAKYYDTCQFINPFINDGYAGNAHLMFKLFDKLGIEVLQTSGLYWLGQTKRALQKKEIDNLLNVKIKNLSATGGIISGLCGTGLVLLDYCNNDKIKFNWNKLILTS